MTHGSTFNALCRVWGRTAQSEPEQHDFKSSSSRETKQVTGTKASAALRVENTASFFYGCQKMSNLSLNFLRVKCSGSLMDVLDI